MNVQQTKEFFEENNIVAVQADKGNENQIDEIEQLLVELGNTEAAIPFYAIYGPGIEKPITADAVITRGWVYESLEKAKGENKSAGKDNPKDHPNDSGHANAGGTKAGVADADKF